MKQILSLIICMLICTPVFAQNRIVVSKKQMTLTVYNNENKVLLTTKISCGKNLGNKQYRADAQGKNDNRSACYKTVVLLFGFRLLAVH